MSDQGAKPLTGKAAIVFGAGGVGNMGQGIVRRLLADGAQVMAVGRQEEPLRALAAETGASFALADLTQREQVFAAVKAAADRFGRLDIGVNAVGWGLIRPFLDNSEADLDAMLAVQFKGPFFFFQAMLTHMEDGGSLVHLSSATATIMLENHSAYMGTKAGIDHVVRTIANEFGHRGIRANSVAPGLTDTPMAGGAFQIPAFVDAFRREYPLDRVGTIADVAAAVAWLARDDCFITGQVLQVNGGLTLRRNPSLSELGSIAAEATAHLTS